MTTETEHRRIKIARLVNRDPGLFAPNFDIPMFDPQNRTTDDYFCLELARKWREDQFMFFCISLKTTWADRLKNQYPNFCCDQSLIYGMYKTGDYMNAYLEITNGE